MKLGLVLAPVLLASTAYAQAPGDYEAGGDADLAPPGMAPVVAAEPAPAPPRPLRWSVGLNLGSLGVRPHQSADTDPDTQFAVGQIALRYRPWRHLEIELALGGGDEQLPDGTAGDRQVSESVLALRYRFSPNNHWNWWLMAGMGSFAVTSKYATDDEKNAATQSTLQFGVGLEHRWHHFALQAEVRAVGVAPNDQDMATYPAGTPTVMPDGSGAPPPSKDPPLYTSPSRDGWKGGQTTIGASYYF